MEQEQYQESPQHQQQQPLQFHPGPQAEIPAISLSGNNANRTLWIGDVPYDWSEQKLFEIFTECSHPPYKVKRTYIKKEIQGYCFVEFTSPEEAQSALYDLNGNRIPGNEKNRFNLCFANDSYNPNGEFNLHVSNVPIEMSDAELYRVFDKYTSCRGAKMFRFGDGTSKGVGFVRFGDQTDQQMALVEMHRTKIRDQRIVLRLAGPRGERLDRDKPTSYSQKPATKYQKKSYSPRQQQNTLYDTYGQPIKAAEPDVYGTSNPWILLPDENDLDPIIGLDLLQPKYRPQASNKRFMIDSEQFFYDLEGSSWSGIVFSPTIKADQLDQQLQENRWNFEK